MKEMIIICGATATGKSDLAIYAAQKLNGEIISADSMQIYKNMNIGTAKVTESEMQGIPHHMIDVVDPDQSYSVAEFQENASKIIDDIQKRDKTPIVVGGTGLYINSLIYGYTFKQTNADTKLREELKEFAQNNGNQALHDLLREKSPSLAEKLHPNDVKRVIRAIETTQLPQEEKVENQIIRPYKAFAFDMDRNVLYDKINRRVDKMFELGLIHEVEDLVNNQKISFECQSMKAIGYKEFYDYFYNNEPIETVKELIKKNSRNYAKRQFTWFRKMPKLNWFKDLDSAKRAIEELI